MTLLISYDITNNRLRKQLADYLEYIGLRRVQKSVFIGYVNRNTRLKADVKAKEIIAQSEDVQDKIIIMPVHLKSLESAIFMGDYGEEFMREVTGQIKVKIY